MACAGGPDTITNGLVLTLDAANLLSYIPPIIVYSVQCYSVYGGGLRSANYTVQYSDDNSTWTTAFTGVMSNNSACGIITGTGVNTSNLTPHRYWRYVEGAAVVGHHPRVSRIDFITPNGSVYNLITSTTDNCADSGIYIIGTISKDFGPSTWYDLSGTNNGTLTNGPTFNGSNGGCIVFDGADDYIISTTQVGISGATARSFECWTYINSNVSKNIMGYGDNGLLNLFDTIIWYTSPYLQVIGHYYGGNNDTISTLPSRNTLNINQWNQIVHLYDGTNASIYTNGVLSNSKSFTLNTTNTTLLLGAGKYTGYNYFSGNIALGRIYNRALTASEVLQNYNELKPRFGI